MIMIRLEVLAGLSDAFGNKGSEPVIFDEEMKEGATVGDIIRKVATEHQTFSDVIIDIKTNQPSGQVTIVLNNQLIEALKSLNTKIKDGDIIRLFPVITGG